MPNTVIQLKKSSTPGSSPSSGNLANGELAINFADGVIYYKNLVGQVAQFIAPGRNYGTVNANGTLLVSAIAGDVFTILPGQNITVTGDAVNDRVTIGADLTSANGWANLVGSSANASSSANDATQGANIAVLAAAFVSNSQSLSANVNILAAAISSGGLANTSGVSFNGNLYFPTGNVGIGTTTPAYKLQVNGSFAANTKSFVIDHPTKSGMKLRYGSLEGPENGVYVRGRLDGIKVIELPDYWEGLVDLNTITVQLTAIGHAQNLYVAAIDGLKIHIDTENHTQPYCYYTVYGERKDVEKLVVEY